VRGTTADNGAVKKVVVNGLEAKSLSGDFAEWEATLEGVKGGAVKLTARATDVAGNEEKRPHEVTVRVER
jgi:hypothetical protein